MNKGLKVGDTNIKLVMTGLLAEAAQMQLFTSTRYEELLITELELLRMQQSSSCVLRIDLHVVIAEIAAPRYAIPRPCSNRHGDVNGAMHTCGRCQVAAGCLGIKRQRLPSLHERYVA